MLKYQFISRGSEHLSTLHGEETAAVRMLLNGAVVLAEMKGNALHHNVWLVGGLEHFFFAIIYEIRLFPKPHRMMMRGWFFVSTR